MGFPTEDVDTVKSELAELEKMYAQMKNNLSEDGERVFATKIREAQQKLKALTQDPSSEKG